MGSVELWQSIVIAALVCVPVLGKVAIVLIALRGVSKPSDKARIIAAVAELFRWWRRPGSGPP